MDAVTQSLFESPEAAAQAAEAARQHGTTALAEAQQEAAVKEAETITETVRWEFVRMGIAWGIATLFLATLALWNGKLAIFIAIAMVLSIMLTRSEPSQAIDKWLNQLSGGLK